MPWHSQLILVLAVLPCQLLALAVHSPALSVGNCAKVFSNSSLRLRASTNPEFHSEVLSHLAKLRQSLFCQDSQLIRIPKGQTIVDLPGNFSMRMIDDMPVYITVYRGTRDWVSNSVLQSGTWETGELNQLMWALEAPLPQGAGPTSSIGNALFVDVGANVGSFTFHVAARGYEVVAFEGMRDNLWLLRTSMCASNHEIMHRVTLHAFGLGSNRTSCHLLTDFNWGNGIPVCGADSDAQALKLYGEPGHSVRGKFDIERMDDVMHRDIKAMKLDCEGFEPQVLQGARHLFRNRTVWFLALEYNIVRLKHTTPSGVKMYQHILDLMSDGYTAGVSGFNGPYLDQAGMEQFLLTVQEQANVYFVHPRLFNTPGYKLPDGPWQG